MPEIGRDRVHHFAAADFCYGSFASVWPDHGDFRSTPVNGHSQDRRAGLKGAITGSDRPTYSITLDACQQGRRNVESASFSRPSARAQAARSKSIIKSRVIGTASRLVDSSI